MIFQSLLADCDIVALAPICDKARAAAGSVMLNPAAHQHNSCYITLFAE